MVKKCIVCGTEFEAKSAKGVYCSSACKMKDMRSKKKVSEEKTTLDGVFKMMEEAQNKPTPSKEFYWAEYPDGEHKGPNSGEPVTVTIQLPPKTDDFFKELEIGINHILEYCRTVGISLQELVRGYMKWREIEMADKSKIETDNYNEGLKKGWDRAEQKYNPFNNPRFTSKMGPPKEDE